MSIDHDKTQLSIPRILGASLVLAALLAACSGSVLYNDFPPVPSAPISSNEPRPDMRLNPLSSPELSARGGAPKLIFGSLPNNSSFDLNNAQSTWILDIRVKSESIDETSLENFVQAQMRILIIRPSDQRILYQRDFRSDGTLTLKNVGDKDQMIGTFKDMESGKVILSIQATRMASSTEMEASKNPWSGSLSLVEEDHSETKLGELTGYFSGPLEPQP